MCNGVTLAPDRRPGTCHSGRAGVSAQSPAVPRPVCGGAGPGGGPAHQALPVGCLSPFSLLFSVEPLSVKTAGAGLSGDTGGPPEREGLRLSPGALPHNSEHTGRRVVHLLARFTRGQGSLTLALGLGRWASAMISGLPRPCGRNQAPSASGPAFTSWETWLPGDAWSAPAACTHALPRDVWSAPSVYSTRVPGMEGQAAAKVTPPERA